MNPLLESCRKNLGPAPRRLGVGDRMHLTTQNPPWLAQDPLQRVVKDRALLFKRGRVVAASLVQANNALFHPGTKDFPALAVWCEDPEWENDLTEVRAWGHRLFELKGTKPEGDLEKLARLITNQRARPMNHKIPESFTGGRAMFLSALLIFRKHLPFGYLNTGILPLLVLPESTPAAIVLPGKYWPEGLKDR